MNKFSEDPKAIIERLQRRARWNNEARESLLRVTNFIAGHERRDSAGNPIVDADGIQLGGTGATVLKFEQSPVARLCNTGNLGNEEMQAVEDINDAFHSIAGGLLIKPQSMERHDKSHSEHEPARLVAAQRRYKSWSNHWSARAKRGDKLLEIVIAAVIDEHVLYSIDARLNLRNGKAKRALVAGLRDYAARAGWADANISAKWIETAESIFTLREA